MNWIDILAFSILNSSLINHVLFFTILSIIAIKNRRRGLFFEYSFNITISDSLFSDNADHSIEVNWVDSLQIKNTIIRGHLAETKALSKPPYFNDPCVVSSYFNPPVGLQIPVEIWGWDKPHNINNVGAILTNVEFTDFDHSDNCAPSVPISFSDGTRMNHFNYFTTFKNVTINGNKIMDAPRSDQEGVKDVVIHDIDGSSDPSGQSSQGMFVSNVNWLKAFAGDSCTQYPNGISYCANQCYRTISFMVDQTVSVDFDLVVTRQVDGVRAIVPYSYKYDENEHLKHVYEYYRFFSISLPDSSYKIEFVKDLQPVWPTFVLPRWEGKPECNGFVSNEKVTIFEPHSECEDLVVNGDMELGVSSFTHQNGGDEASGALLAVEGAGVNGSTALRLINRTSHWAALGSHFDTRCLHQGLNELYEIRLYFRYERIDTPIICNPWSSTWEERCPVITFKREKYVDEKLQTSWWRSNSEVVVPNYIGDFSLMHGVFEVDENLNTLDRVYMYLELVHMDYDIIVDDVTVKKLQKVCGEELVRNGGFEESSIYWRRYGGNVQMDIESSSSKSLKVFNRANNGDGVYEDLYIDKDCFQQKQRFKITGEYFT